MKPRTLIVLLVVLTMLCGVYWGLLHWEERNRRAEEAEKVLFSFPPEAIARLLIDPFGEPAIAGVRNAEGEWRITAPYDLNAAQPPWNQAATAFAGLKNQRSIERNPEDLEAYGLDRPRTTVTATTSEGETEKLVIGAQDPTDQFFYAMRDDLVFLAASSAVVALDKTLLDLRRRYAFEGVGEEGVTRVEISKVLPPEEAVPDTVFDEDGPPGYKTEPMAVELENGEWRVTAPAPGPADQERVEEFVAAIQFAAGMEYIDEPESYADYGLRPPTWHIDVYFGDAEEPQTLYVGQFDVTSEEGRVFVQPADEDYVMAVDSRIVSAFPSTPYDFRRRPLYTGDLGAVTAVRYVDAEHTLVLENLDDAGWTLVEPASDFETDQVAVNGALALLGSLEAARFFSEGARDFGLEEPEAVFTLTSREGEPAVIELGAEDEAMNLRYARQDTGAVLGLPATAAEDLFWKPDSFLSNSLIEFDRSQVRRVTLDYEGTRYVFVQEASRWKVEEPAGKRWDLQTDMVALLDAIDPLESQGQAQPPPEAELGLDDPTLRVSAVTEGAVGEVTHGPLSVGAIQSGEQGLRYARIDGKDDVILVSQELIHAVREALRGIVDR